MDVTPPLISAFPLLKSLPSEVLNDLAQSGRAEKFVRRQIVLDPEGADKSVCFLFEGRLQGIDFTVDGREVGLFFVEKGDFCGELSLFNTNTRPEIIIALSKSVVVKLPITKIRNIMNSHPSVMSLVGHKLAKRISDLTFQRSMLAINNIEQRVCCQLWLLCKNAFINDSDNEAEIINPPTHLELANMLSLSRESVTRVFQTLQNQQIVRRNGSTSLIISAVDKLRELANDQNILNKPRSSLEFTTESPKLDG